MLLKFSFFLLLFPSLLISEGRYKKPLDKNFPTQLPTSNIAYIHTIGFFPLFSSYNEISLSQANSSHIATDPISPILCSIHYPPPLLQRLLPFSLQTSLSSSNLQSKHTKIFPSTLHLCPVFSLLLLSPSCLSSIPYLLPSLPSLLGFSLSISSPP